MLNAVFEPMCHVYDHVQSRVQSRARSRVRLPVWSLDCHKRYQFRKYRLFCKYRPLYIYDLKSSLK